jgi:hypothetical protein
VTTIKRIHQISSPSSNIRTSPGYASEGGKEKRQVTCMIQSNKMLSVLKLGKYIVVLGIFLMAVLPIVLQ